MHQIMATYKTCSLNDVRDDVIFRRKIYCRHNF